MKISQTLGFALLVSAAAAHQFRVGAWSAVPKQSILKQEEVATSTRFGENASTLMQCPFWKVWLGTSAQVVLVLCMLICFKRKIHACCPAECARSLLLLVACLGMSSSTLVVIDSYKLAKAMGEGATFSGTIISCFAPGQLIGAIMVWVAVSWDPLIWKKRPALVLTLGLALQIAGWIAYISVALDANVDQPPSIVRQGVLLGSRVLVGMGAGSGANLLQVKFSHITPKTERPEQMGRYIFARMMGCASGAFLAASQSFMNVCPSAGTQPTPRFELVGLVGLLNCLGVLVAVCLWYPSMETIEDYEPKADITESQNQVAEGTSPIDDHRHWVIIGCLAITLLRGFCVSGLEAATTMILEVDHNWKAQAIGLVLSMTFLAIVPLRWGHGKLKDRLSVANCIRSLAAFSIVGSILMIMAPHYAWRLILADIILFPSFYWGDGLVMGLMAQHLSPTGFLLDANNVPGLSLLLVSVGRFLGPISARDLIAQGGQSTYAVMQVMACVSFLVVFETVSRPNIQETTSIETRSENGKVHQKVGKMSDTQDDGLSEART